MYNYKDDVYISVNVVDFILISPFHAIKNGTFPCDRTCNFSTALPALQRFKDTEIKRPKS